MEQYQIKTSKQLSDILEKYQSGNAVSSDINSSEPNDVEPAISSRDAALNRDISGSFTRDNTSEALTSGYGASKYDNVYTAGQDVEQTRALNQSGIAKIASGAAKFGVTALGTFVNTSLGLASGIIEGAAAVITDGNKDGKRTVGEFFDAATTNEVADFTLKMQKWAEEVFPNYYTQEERSDEYQRQWYKHMLSPNSIGDDILKNFGFTVGSIAGAGSWMKLLSKKAVRNLSGDVMKGALMGAEGDAASTAELKRVSEALQRGNLTRVNIDQLGNNIKNVGRTINTKRALTQVSGATIAAFSEGTFEGVNARDEWLNEFTEKAKSDLKDAYAKAEQDIFNSNNSAWVNNAGSTILGPDGSFMTVPALTFEGRRELGDKKYGLTQDYNRLMKEAETEGDRIAAATFGLNCLILIPSNLFQFGRILAGGWKTNRKMARLTGDIARGYTVGGSNLGTALRKSGAVALSEASEEILQGTVSSGTKSVADARLSSFNDKAYDPEQVRSARFWFENFISGADDYLSDVKNWKEGALGAITGLIGIPGRRWNGGVVGAIQDARDERDAASGAASYLNNIINSADFRSRWDGFIRHNAYDDDMAKAVKNNDQYSYHTASDMQLISDIVAFSDAGKLDDLKDFADSFVNISDEDIQILVDDRNKRGDNISVEDLRNKINENAKNIKNHIDAYKNLYDYHMSRATGDVSPQLMNEIIATSMQIKDYENRFVSVINDALTAIEPKLSEYEGKAKADKAKDAKSNLTDIRDFIENSLGLLNPVSIYPAIADKIDKQLEEAIGELNLDKETAQKLRDARKLNKDRNAFYNKLNTLQTPAGAEQFEQQAQTPEKKDIESEKQHVAENTSGLNSIDDIKRAYFPKKNKDRIEFFNQLRSIQDKNKYAKEFVRMVDTHKAFLDYVNANSDELISRLGVLYGASAIDELARSVIRNAKTVEDIINLPDTAFESYNEFSQVVKNSTNRGKAPLSVYNKVKELLREQMNSMLSADSDTESRKTIKPEQTVRATDSETTDAQGYDAAQEASSVTPEKKNKLPDDNFAVDDLIAGENYDADGNVTGTWTAKVTKVFDNGAIEVEGGVQYTKRMVDEFFGKVPPSTKGAYSKIVKNSRLGDAIPYNESEYSEQQQNLTKETKEETGRPVSVAEQNMESEPVDLSTDELNEKIASGKFKYHPFYRTSVPEIDSTEAAKAREAKDQRDIEKFKEADLSDFVIEGNDKNQSYKQLWNQLKVKGAFDSIVNELNVGDEIEFVIDPTFTPWEGDKTHKANDYEVLMTVVKNGERKVLSVLSYQEGNYLGLHALRKAINDEYNAEGVDHSKLFVFSKKSQVYMKRPGLVEYGFNEEDERSFKEIPGYSESLPVVYVNSIGNITSVVGDKTAVNRTIGNLENTLPGQMYTLVKSGLGGDKEYVPVALRTASLTRDTKDLDKPTINKIRQILENIERLTNDATNSNVSELNDKLKSEIHELRNYLDVHDMYFKIDNFNNIGPSILIVPNWNHKPKTSDEAQVDYEASEDAAAEQSDNKERIFVRPNQKASGWLIDYISELNDGKGKHIQLSEQQTKESGEDERSISRQRFNELLDEDLITTNAKMLRAKGADFYVLPFDKKQQNFGSVTTFQVNALKNFSGLSKDTQDTQASSDSSNETHDTAPEEFDNTRESIDDIDVGDMNFHKISVSQNPVRQKISEQDKASTNFVVDKLRSVGIDVIANDNIKTDTLTDELRSIKERAIADGTFMKAPNGNSTNLTERQWLQVRTKAFKDWFGDWENEPANASKVVDENVEPLVVYHGTTTPFSTFDKNKQNSRNPFGQGTDAFFFTDKESNAEKIAISSREGDLIINGESLWHSNYPYLNARYISDKVGYKVSDDFKELLEGAEDLYSEKVIRDYYKAIGEDVDIKKLDSSFSGIHAVFLNIKNMRVKDYEGKNLMKTSSKEFDSFVNESKDGGVLKNIVDGRMELADTYFVKEPNQIKSATDNNGEFSRTNNNIYKFKTSFGDVYGYTTNGKIYIDTSVAKSDTPIHEYTHLWAHALRTYNPTEWKKIVSSMKKLTSVWDYVKSTYPELSTDNAIADEVLAHYSGAKGSESIDKFIKEDKSIIGKLKSILRRFWNEVAKMLGIVNDSPIDISDWVMRDLMDGVNPNDITSWKNRHSSPKYWVVNTNYDVERIARGGEAQDIVMKIIDDDFDSLPSEIHSLLVKRGYTPQNYDNLPEALKERILRCAGA